MRADDGAVDHLECALPGTAGHQSLKNAFKYPDVASTSKPAPDGVPLAEALG
jgi:hypothetical protein